MGPGDLEEIIRGIRVPAGDSVIVGIESNDDAGVFRISEDIALVQTVDFITPILDDPREFGRVAACNSLSDVYAMGGRPLTALNVVCFPVREFPLEVLGEILRGGLEILTEAGVSLIGGHSVEDPELKYGLSVTGTVHPDRVVRNNTLRAGDAIVLTKPIGTGVLATAIKAGACDRGAASAMIASMTALNRAASAIMLRHGVDACTDVTGFGLLGHLREMIGNAGLAIVVDAASVPLLPGALDAARGGLVPGGTYRNRKFVESICAISPAVSREAADLLFDPQTSGGLLIALPDGKAAGLLEELRAAGLASAAIVARVRESEACRLEVS